MPKKAFKRAIRDTWDAIIGGHLGSFVFGLLALAIGYAEPLLAEGWRKVIADAWSVALNGIYGIAGAAVLMFVYQLLVAPYRIQKERADSAETQLQKVLPQGKRQALLDEISDLRQRIVELRIEVRRDVHGLTRPNVWEERYRALQDSVAEKIEAYASRAEANTFKTKGNIVRRATPHRNQQWIDYCIHDIDYLTEFIKDYSRGKK